MTTHKSLFFGKQMVTRYLVNSKYGYLGSYNYGHRYGYQGKPEFIKSSVFNKYVLIHESEFDKPPLEIGEKVYIKELDILAKVEDRARSTSGEYVYYLDYTKETIEDDETKISEDRALIKYEHELSAYEGQIKKAEQQQQEREKEELKPKKKKWFQ